MSVIWAEGFEHYGTNNGRTNMLKGLWSAISAVGTNGIFSGVDARTGTHYYQINTNSSSIRRAVGERTMMGIAFGIRFPNLPSNSGTHFQFWDGSSNVLASLVWQPDGSIRIYKGSHLGTLLDQTEQVITSGTWHHVEVIITISETIGSIETRVDGIPVSILTDLNLGTTPIAQVLWGCQSSLGVLHHVDDIVAHTGAEFIGPARVHTVYLDADFSPFGDWIVTGAATGAEAVDETEPDGDTSYITAENEGDVARFVMPSLPLDVNEITAIHIPVMARQNEAGLTRIQTTLLSGAEAVDGDEHALTPTYSYVEDAFNTDPATGEGWNRTSFEAATLEITRTV